MMRSVCKGTNSHDLSCTNHHLCFHNVTIDILSIVRQLSDRKVHHLSQFTCSKYSPWFSCCFETISQQNTSSRQPNSIMGWFNSKKAKACLCGSELFTEWQAEPSCAQLGPRAPITKCPKRRKERHSSWGYSPVWLFPKNRCKQFGHCCLYYLNKILKASFSKIEKKKKKGGQ